MDCICGPIPWRRVAPTTHHLRGSHRSGMGCKGYSPTFLTSCGEVRVLHTMRSPMEETCAVPHSRLGIGVEQ